MVNHWVANGHLQCMNQTIDIVNDDIDFVVCMSNTTCDTELDKTTVSGYSTLDEYDGGSRPPVFASRDSVPNSTLALAATNRVKWGNGGTSLTLSSFPGPGTRDAIGIMIYAAVTDDTASIPLMWLGTANFFGNGGDVVLTEHADGFGYFTHPSA